MDGKSKLFLPRCPLRLRGKNQDGNAMVYVLVVVALFAALSFVLARQSDTSESTGINSEKAEIYAGTIQQAAMQLKQAVEQMTFTGTQAANLDFVTPDDTVPFNTEPHMDKVFHPSGGGVILPRLPDDAIDEDALVTTPPARWYIGRFNNVEWTPSAAEDVILTAHQIKQGVCERLNYKLTGSTVIPETAVGDQVNEMIIDGAESAPAVGNINFTSAECPGCFGASSLCIKDNGANSWSFYSIIAAE